MAKKVYKVFGDMMDGILVNTVGHIKYARSLRDKIDYPRKKKKRKGRG